MALTYETIAEAAKAEFYEKRSRFLSEIRPVRTREEAGAMITELSSKYWDASHNVYAYILREGQAVRYSDDKEPQGTAGIPVLDVLRKEGLTDVCVVVTRYFGGILLGGGGLVRAYGQSCALACKAAQRIVMTECIDLSVSLDYTFYGKVPSVIEAHGAHLLDSVFHENVTVSVTLPPENAEAFSRDLLELTGGKAEINLGKTRFFAQKVKK